MRLNDTEKKRRYRAKLAAQAATEVGLERKFLTRVIALGQTDASSSRLTMQASALLDQLDAGTRSDDSMAKLARAFGMALPRESSALVGTPAHRREAVERVNVLIEAGTATPADLRTGLHAAGLLIRDTGRIDPAAAKAVQLRLSMLQGGGPPPEHLLIEAGDDPGNIDWSNLPRRDDDNTDDDMEDTE